MKKEIYEVNEKIADIMDKYLDPNTGEIALEASVEFEKLGIQREHKIEELALIVKENQLYADGLDAEIKRLQSRKRMAMNSINWLTEQVRKNVNEGEKFKTPKFEIKWTTSNALYYDDIIVNWEQVYKDKKFKKFVKKTISFAPDKNALKQAIKEKKAVPESVVINTTKNLKIN